jgi:hypothetical protein
MNIPIKNLDNAVYLVFRFFTNEYKASRCCGYSPVDAEPAFAIEATYTKSMWAIQS